MSSIHESFDTPIIDQAEVLIVGGGIAGAAAALAAKREGADVLLLEKTIQLGGLATNGLISWYEPLCDGEGHQLIYGLAEELLRLSVKRGGNTIPEIWQDRSIPVDFSKVADTKQDPIGGRYGTFFSPTLFQLSLSEQLQHEGIRIRYNISVVSVAKDADGRCTAVITESPEGRGAITARAIVDASGDATVFDRAGVPCVSGQNFFTYVMHINNRNSANDGFFAGRKWLSVGSDLHGNGNPEGLDLSNSINNLTESNYNLRGQLELLRRIDNWDEIRDVATLPSQTQYRKTRRLVGEATLTPTDCFHHSDRSIGLSSDFERVGDWYEIPYETLWNASCPNILAAGRMVSADDWAWDMTRVIPVCALTGQAAGTAAALMAKSHDLSAPSIPIELLQRHLYRAGVRLHRDEA